MDRIEKALLKLSAGERAAVKGILQKLLYREFKGLQIKKLKGRRDIFRVRKGNIRIIYRITKEEDIFLLAIERRSENTYKE